jgi:hypothetical protein
MAGTGGTEQGDQKQGEASERSLERAAHHRLLRPEAIQPVALLIHALMQFVP